MVEIDMLYEFAKTEFDSGDDDEKSRLIYSYHGLAMYLAQCIEKTLENMLIVKKLSERENLTHEFIDTIFEKVENSRSTLGNLIAEVKKVYSISEEHEKELKTVLTLRNFFAHNFFKVNSFKTFTHDGKLEMIKQCTDFINQSKLLDTELENYYKKFILKLGLTEEMILEEVEKARTEEYERIKKTNGG